MFVHQATILLKYVVTQLDKLSVYLPYLPDEEDADGKIRKIKSDLKELVFNLEHETDTHLTREQVDHIHDMRQVINDLFSHVPKSVRDYH